MRRAPAFIVAGLLAGCGGGGGSGPSIDASPGNSADAAPGTPDAAPGSTPDARTGGLPDAGPGGQGGAGRYFAADAWFYRDISGAPVRPESDSTTAWMVDYTTNVRGSGPYGWGSDTSEMRIDFSITVVDAPSGTAKRSFSPVDGYYYPPDCDLAPMPVPMGGSVEQPYDAVVDLTGFNGYACQDFDQGADCHLIVFAPWESRLYEVYHASIDGGVFQGGCQAIWDVSHVLGDGGRGAGCTSADAAGFPMAPLLFRADDVAAGELTHAIRLVLPNEMIHDRHYVPPATHSTNSGGPPESVPYGALFRLKADYPVESLPAGAQVVARAMQRYGMYVADGGQIALTAENDLLLPAKWSDVGFDSYTLADLRATDFEIIDTGPRVYDPWDCQRNQITQ